jgi:PIN like domain
MPFVPTAKHDEPLEVFVDRSLGRYAIPQALRDLGLFKVLTMAEFYGEEKSQQLLDVQWLEDVAVHKWVVLTKDRQMMRPQTSGAPNPELAKLAAVGARVFCVMGQQLSAAEQIERLKRHAKKIVSVARARPGPYAYGIYADGMREIWRPE